MRQRDMHAGSRNRMFVMSLEGQFNEPDFETELPLVPSVTVLPRI